MTRILVTGAAGFLGFHLAKRLADESADVLCVDNFIRGEADALYAELTARPNVTAFEADLTEAEQVRGLPDDVDMIFHMAALNGTQNFYERPFEVVRCCTLPTLHLLDKYGPPGRLKRWIYAGTSEAYASTVTRFGWEVPTGEDVPLSFDDPTNARWSYGASKMHGEIATTNACRHFGLPWTIIRFHNAYGPRMGDKHVVPDFLTRAKQGVYELFGHSDTRSFIYVDDAIRATRDLGFADAATGQIVNVGSDREITILALAEKMMASAGMVGEITLHPSPSGSVKRRAPRIDKLRDLIGFKEEWSLEEGLAETARFYLADHG